MLMQTATRSRVYHLVLASTLPALAFVLSLMLFSSSPLTDSSPEFNSNLLDSFAHCTNIRRIVGGACSCTPNFNVDPSLRFGFLVTFGKLSLSVIVIVDILYNVALYSSFKCYRNGI